MDSLGALRGPLALSELETVPCNLCGRNDPLTLFTRGAYGFVRCRHCGLTYLSPRDAVHTISLMYSAQYFRIEGADTHEVSGYRDYIADGPMLRRQARSSLAHLERFVAEPHGRLLEIGCAAGFFLDEARARGWSPTGVEVSRFAATSG